MVESSILLVGGGGHCRAVIDVIDSDSHWKIAGVVDSNIAANARVLGYAVLGGDEVLALLRQTIGAALVTVGQIKSAEVRKRIWAELRRLGFERPVVVSPHAYVSKYATVGMGSVLMHFAMVGSNSRIGENCIINSGAKIDHDCVIADHCHISTSAILNGGVSVGEGAFVGSRAVLAQGVSIGAGAIVGMGARVRHDVAPGVTFFGE